MTTTASTGPTALDRTFGSLRRSPITRSSDRVIAGVCSGIAARLGVSTTIVRVAAVVLAVLTPGVLLYLLAWLMLPDASGRVQLESAVRDGKAGSIALLVVSALVLIGELNIHHSFGWLVLAGIIAYVLIRGRRGAHHGGHGTGYHGTGHVSGTAYPQDAPRG